MGRWAGWPKWDKWSREGEAPATYSITGTINDADGNGLDGVTVTLTGDASDSTVTAGGGAYEFTGLSAGSYTVTPTKAGLTFNPTSAAVTITTANKTAATMASVWEITGTINDSAGAGLSGVLVTLSGDASATDTTDGSGAYNFPNLANGSYTVTPTKAGSTFSPASDAVTVNGADKVATTMAQVWEITGQILDSAGAGLSGVLVTLTGDASDTDTTDGSGNYSFPGLSDGSYTVTPTKSGSTFNPASRAATISGADDALSSMSQVWTLSGSITDINDAAIQGVLVTLSGDASDTDTTDASGDYSFPNLVDGSYTVTPTKSELEFTPASSAESISGADDTATTMQGFLALPRFVVWTDGNLDESAKQGAYSVINIPADNNSYTPSGYTKAVYCNMDGDSTDFITFDVGSGQFAIDDLAAPNGFKVEIMIFGEDTQSAVGIAFGSNYTSRANVFGSNRLYGRWADDADTAQISLANDTPTSFINNESAITSNDVRRWTKFRLNFDHGNGLAGTYVKRAQDGQTYSNSGRAYPDTWANMAVVNMRYAMPYHFQGKDVWIAYIWVGDLNDSWPGE